MIPTITEMDKRIARMKNLIQEYAECQDELGLPKITQECFFIANGLCPYCGTDEAVERELLGDHWEHYCRGSK